MPEDVTVRVLIAHSDPLMSAGLAAILTAQRDFKVMVCGADFEFDSMERRSLSQCLAVADYDCGLRLAASKSAWGGQVMILTHSDSEAQICRALEQGVRGYLLFGCSTRELVEGLLSMHVGGSAFAPVVTSRIADRMNREALTAREEEILRQLMLGSSNKRIALELALAVGTVKTHVKSILQKLQAKSRTEAIAIAQRQGVLQEKLGWPHPRAPRLGSRRLWSPVIL
jgi:DNA-binding NarL/FixJ family response regulator